MQVIANFVDVLIVTGVVATICGVLLLAVGAVLLIHYVGSHHG